MRASYILLSAVAFMHLPVWAGDASAQWKIVTRTDSVPNPSIEKAVSDTYKPSMIQRGKAKQVYRQTKNVQKVVPVTADAKKPTKGKSAVTRAYGLRVRVR